jgi:hypothetical protein
MADTGWKITGSASNVDYSSGSSWNDPSYVTANDSNYDYNQISKSDDSDWLRCSSFSAGVPSGAHITGIAVILASYVNSAAYTRLGLIQVGNDSSNLSSTSYGPTSQTTSRVEYTYGGDGNLWGLTGLNSSVCNSDNFLVQVRFGNTDSGLAHSAYVDYVAVNFYYTLYTITADTKALTLTSAAGALSRTRAVASDTKALTLTATLSKITATRYLPTTTRALTLTTNGATFSRTRSIGSTTRALTLGWQQASVAAARVLYPEATALTASFSTATLDQGLTTAGLSLSISAKDAVLTASRKLSPDAASLSLEATASTLSVSMSSVTVSLAIAVPAAFLTADRVLPAESKSVTLTGNAADFVSARRLNTPTWQLTLLASASKLSIFPPRPTTFASMLVKPANKQVVNPKTGAINHEWEVYFRGLTDRLNSLNSNSTVM